MVKSASESGVSDAESISFREARPSSPLSVHLHVFVCDLSVNILE